MSRRRALFYVQHLLGIGHLKRAAILARAFVAAGLDVTVVSGGYEVPGLDLGGADLVQLPPVRATDLRFNELVDEGGAPIDDAWRDRRRALLLAAWQEVQPHVLLLELFPFGRRQMRFELMPLLDAATAAARRPVIVSSVRDILVARTKPGRNEEMRDLVETHFDQVLVHGDPRFVPFAETFGYADRIATKCHYTGYVVDRSEVQQGPGSPGFGEVVVSAGGGAVGEALLRAAMAARARTRLKDAVWRVLVGTKVPEPTFRSLRAAAAAGIVVERARPDFTTLLANAVLSISQGGYNTVMEVLHAGVRAVVVPYSGGIETEQPLRAARLARRGGITLVAEAELGPEALAGAVERAMDSAPGSLAGIDTDGAAQSARLVSTWAAAVGW